MKVGDVLRFKGADLFTTTPETVLAQAVAVMVEKDIGSLVVIEPQGAQTRVAGMLTFREVLQVVAAAERDPRCGNVASLRVRDVMTRAVICAPEQDMETVSQMMLSHHTRYMPVVDEPSGALLGVVSFFDMAKATMESRDFENQLLKAYIRQWPQGEHEPNDSAPVPESQQRS